MTYNYRMHDWDQLTGKELKLLHARLEHYIASLYQSKGLGKAISEDISTLDALIDEATFQRDYVAGQLLHHRLESRRRPVAQRGGPRKTVFLFLDECGGHATNRVDTKFPVFCLCGLVVDADKYRKQLAPRWSGFKAKYLGSIDQRIHEPSFRGKRLKYWLNSYGGHDPADFIKTLDSILREADYRVITTVIKKEEYRQFLSESPTQVFLPTSQYHIALDFILERFVHYLHYEAEDAEGLVIAERIGPKETSQLMHEYNRLKIEGTQYISPSWFRYQLAENVMFGDKEDFIPGLEITDVIARPIAEKVLAPSADPTRWNPIREKFYDGGQDRPESYGLKAFPTPVSKELFKS